jgi:hypothetical protein
MPALGRANSNVALAMLLERRRKGQTSEIDQVIPRAKTYPYLAAAISSTMAWAVARGSSAARIGLPTTT